MKYEFTMFQTKPLQQKVFPKLLTTKLECLLSASGFLANLNEALSSLVCLEDINQNGLSFCFTSSVKSMMGALWQPQSLIRLPPKTLSQCFLSFDEIEGPFHVRAQTEGRRSKTLHSFKVWLELCTFCWRTWLFPEPPSSAWQQFTCLHNLAHGRNLLYGFFALTVDNDLQHVGEIHHLAEHLHDVRMTPGSTDKLLQRQLTCGHDATRTVVSHVGAIDENLLVQGCPTNFHQGATLALQLPLKGRS